MSANVNDPKWAMRLKCSSGARVADTSKLLIS